MGSPHTLASRVRAKYPGAYDDLDDTQLEAAVVAKFPGVYDDVPKTTAQAAPSMADRALSTAGDVAVGAVKGLGNTVVGYGEMVHRIPGVSRVIDAVYGQPGLSSEAFKQGREVMRPTNAAQHVGQAVEQIGEFFVPTGAKKYKTAAEAVKSGVTSLAQTGSPMKALESAALSVVLPPALRAAGSAAKNASGALVASAEKKVVQALGAQKERFKAMAERLAPQILRRGLGGSREALLEQAVAKVDEVSAQLDDALTTYGKDPVGVQPVVDALEKAKDAFRTTGMSGNVVEYEPRAITQLAGLQQTLADLGSHPTVDQLVAIRRAWDKVVDQAGGFAHRAAGAIGVPLKDQSEAWAKREATGAIRKLLADELPDLAAINKEYAFWRSLKDVLTQTQQRTQPQGPGVGKAIATVAGAAAGASGGITTAVAAGIAGRQIQALVTSPRWRLASARVRSELADALASGIPARIQTTAARISASLPAQVRPTGASQ